MSTGQHYGNASKIDLPQEGGWKKFTAKEKILLLIIIAVQTVIFCIGLFAPPWGDEAHFVDTIKEFGKGLTLNTFKTYNEMSTPLPFIVYSLWGKIFTFDLPVLRVLSLIIAIATYCTAYKLSFSATNNKTTALWLTGFLVIHPYMAGFSVFVFTDMLAILFLLLSVDAVLNNKPWTMAVWLASSVLCRQYLAFLLLAGALYFMLKYLKSKSVTDLKAIVAVCASTIPMAALFILWHGASPDNVWRRVYQHDTLQFHAGSLTLYIMQCFVYLLPLLIVYRKDFYHNRTLVLAGFALSLLYVLAPVEASFYASALNHVDTVGFFHKAVRFVFPQTMEQSVFYLCFAFALPPLLVFAEDAVRKLKTSRFDFLFYLELSLVCFLTVLPFSYLAWEKYFMPVLPLLALAAVLLPLQRVKSVI